MLKVTVEINPNENIKNFIDEELCDMFNVEYYEDHVTVYAESEADQTYLIETFFHYHKINNLPKMKISC